MVAGSRSSLRRPTLRGHKSTRSSSLPNNDTPPLLPQSGESGNAHRTKRARTSTIPGQEQDLKRRRLSTHKSEVPQLRIPLRSRGGVPKVVSPPSGAPPNASPPKLPINTSPTTKPLDSPSGKPQYDQIKIIEEKAKASIREGSLSAAQAERRKLRSEDGGSRAKTELAQYFPDFEEMLSLKPPDPVEVLTVQSKIVLIDDTPDFKPAPPRPDPFGTHKPLHNTEVIQLNRRGISTGIASHDPLDDEVYSKIHAKAERHEKQMKNGDRERAQHEKYQLEKLLDDLRGPDWLKTLGISGVTDTEKKRYEPKRLLFIRETQGLIDKFKRWKEEEKRRKLEREQALLEEAMEDEEDATSWLSDELESADSESSLAPNSSELDALASQQLIEEAKNANTRKKSALEVTEVTELPASKPFVSFFEKKHLRDAAVAGRQRGRTISAFGRPVPEFTEQEFELPHDVLTEEAIRASQRSRRRLRRGVDD
ncbi:hypothetical protein A1O3_09405 [Capronia epimyces CBS 606.96]|uniref:Something about silencing protein 4 domain-containing protein n=1 Tax=Capronia epimyces CBS 606.96 TaxID=1182542 RepID=W9Y751_9EURO|nr:uncharacterized protein A1O3_09405 [Capronia epimyces CBS 606.96]EXJ78244.1 hypothetical protein A1O3_09405 [Capronia epimyces CBS 606.96]